jgi:hypothetical protein
MIKFKKRFYEFMANVQAYEQVYVGPATDKYRTISVFVLLDNNLYGVGTAVKSPEDTWDYSHGRSVALGKALESMLNSKLDVLDQQTTIEDLLHQDSERAVQDTIEKKKRYFARVEANMARKLARKRKAFGL